MKDNKFTVEIEVVDNGFVLEFSEYNWDEEKNMYLTSTTRRVANIPEEVGTTVTEFTQFKVEANLGIEE